MMPVIGLANESDGFRTSAFLEVNGHCRQSVTLSANGSEKPVIESDGRCLTRAQKPPVNTRKTMGFVMQRPQKNLRSAKKSQGEEPLQQQQDRQQADQPNARRQC
jgi:hypothetical protein